MTRDTDPPEFLDECQDAEFDEDLRSPGNRADSRSPYELAAEFVQQQCDFRENLRKQREWGLILDQARRAILSQPRREVRP